MSRLFDSRLADIIRKPVITEKATNALDLNQYTFEVDHRAAKPQIKAAIEALFSVKVIGINTMNPPRRQEESVNSPGSVLKLKRQLYVLLKETKFNYSQNLKEYLLWLFVNSNPIHLELDKELLLTLVRLQVQNQKNN